MSAKWNWKFSYFAEIFFLHHWIPCGVISNPSYLPVRYLVSGIAIRPMPQPTSSTLSAGFNSQCSTKIWKNAFPIALKSPAPTNTISSGGINSPQVRIFRSIRLTVLFMGGGINSLIVLIMESFVRPRMSLAPKDDGLSHLEKWCREFVKGLYLSEQLTPQNQRLQVKLSHHFPYPQSRTLHPLLELAEIIGTSEDGKINWAHLSEQVYVCPDMAFLAQDICESRNAKTWENSCRSLGCLGQYVYPTELVRGKCRVPVSSLG